MLITSKGYIIHQRPYLENKQWLTVLTQHHGLLSMLTARSAKKSFLSPFQVMDITLQEKNQGFKIKKIEAGFFSPPLPRHWLWLGLYLNELIYKLYQPEMTIEEVFDAYTHTLQTLRQTSDHICDPIKAVRQFEHCLQENMGYALSFQCLEQNPADWWYFSPEEGFQPSHSHLHNRIHRQTLIQLSRLDWDSQAVQKLSKQLFIQIINHHLGENKLFIKHLVPHHAA